MATLTIQGAIAMPSGQRSVSLVITESSSPVDEVAIAEVTSGDFTVALPPTAAGTVKGCLVNPVGVSATTVLKVRQISGDTGNSIAVDNPSALSFNANALPTSLIFNASATGGQLEISFY